MIFDKKGFTLIESLLALFVFGLVLSLYLPSFYEQLQKRREVQEKTEQFRIFHELAQLTLEGGRAEDYAQRLEGHLSVAHFTCSERACEIQFQEGTELSVVLEDVQ